MQLWILLILLNIIYIYIDCKNALYALIWQMEFDTFIVDITMST